MKDTTAARHDTAPETGPPTRRAGSTMIATRRFSRRAVATTAAWSVPAIALSVASPAYATSTPTTIEFAGTPASAASGSIVSGAQVIALGNDGADITVGLTAGFAWADGTVSPFRVVGIGPGTHRIPDFRATGSPAGGTGVHAESAGVRAWAGIGIVAGLYQPTVLGAMGIICRGPDEFRADLAVTVPRGVRPSDLYYRFYPTAETERINTKMSLVTDDIRAWYNENYAIVHVQDLGNGEERLFLSCRGNANTANVATALYQWPVRATWPDGTESVVEFPILHQHRGSDGRPVAINAWDRTTSGLPGYDKTLSSQAAWGNVVRADTLATLDGNWFHVDALASGRSAAEGNDQSSEVYYQFVHEDGTPASVTPTPKLAAIPSHSGSISVKGILLGTPDHLGRSFTLDKPGYWRLLSWPQSNNSKAGPEIAPDGVAWDPATDPGHQIGSVFWKLPETAQG